MNALPADKLCAWCAQYGILLTEPMLVQFENYRQFMTEYNEKVNLTAITEPEAVAILHFLDSLLLLHAAPPKEGASLIDIGTGAGFPGVPVRIARPDIELTLLDSTRKRVAFLNALSERLALPCQTVHARAEDAGRNPLYRERYDIAAARAVAPLPILCEYCLPFVRLDGLMVALKSRALQDEAASSIHALRALGGRLESVSTYQLPDGSSRAIAVIRKISQTATKYPRTSAKMAKNPL